MSIHANNIAGSTLRLTDAGTGTTISFDITFSAVDSLGNVLDVAADYMTINQSLGGI